MIINAKTLRTVVRKYVVLLMACFFSCALTAQAQEKQPFAHKNNPLFLNEYTVSFNRVMVRNEGGENGNGFGISLMHSWVDSSWYDVLTGFGYNYLVQHIDYVNTSKWSHRSDVSYYRHYLNFSGIFRPKLGSKQRFFLEVGMAFNFNFFTYEMGQLFINSPDSYQDRPYLETYGAGPRFNLISGIGIEFPFQEKYTFLLKANYHFGITHRRNYYGFLNPSAGFGQVSVGFSWNKD